MEIIKSIHAAWPCVTITERLDTMTAPELEKAGCDQLEEAAQMALDFSQLDYISSAGLRTLLILGKKAQAKGGSVVLCGASGMVKEILEESGINDFFVTYNSVSDLP